MSAITGFSGVGILPFLSSSSPQSAAVRQALRQDLDLASALGAGGGGTTTSASSAGTATTGFSVTPKLSAGVIDTLLKSQARQSPGGTPGPSSGDQTTNLSGASASAKQAGAPSDSSHGPQTLQEIAGQFDPHNLTHQQEEQLQGDLVSSGVLTPKDGFSFFNKTVLSDFFDSQHYRIINGQFVATTPSAPGTIIGKDAPGGPQYDVIQRYQQALAFDQSNGDTQNAAEDKKILGVLNQIESIRNGSGSASASTSTSA